MSAPRVAVVGAGLAGLAAGMSLRRNGVKVELFERTRLLGGKATSFSVDGVEVDNGQHVVLGCCTEFLSFVDEAGMRSRLRMQDRFEVTMLQAGRRPARLSAASLSAPLHLAPSFMRYPLLSVRDKVAVARALRRAAREPQPPGNMAAWLSRTGQSLACRRAFWDPFLVPALNAPLEQVAARDGVFVIRTAFLSGRDSARIGWTTVPLARVAESAAARCDAVHLRSGVSALVLEDGAAVGVTTDGEEHRGFDAVVLALPPHRLAPLLAGCDAATVATAAAFTTQPIV
ncbi:MAG: FAD-dependent oxidoreductase, partial [Candidatus Dormibacteraeota bacterium]|nr:FAD-dependent oxidoreductase [Candidatus Dormibacteraeota bacterium]